MSSRRCVLHVPKSPSPTDRASEGILLFGGPSQTHAIPGTDSLRPFAIVARLWAFVTFDAPLAARPATGVRDRLGLPRGGSLHGVNTR